MSHPPHKPPHESSEGHARHDDTLPAVPAGQDAHQNGRQDENGHNRHDGHDGRRVLEAEVILDDGQEQQNSQGQTYGQGHGRGSSDGRGFFYSRTFGGRGAGGFQAGGSPLGHIWISQRNDANACLAPCVTFAIFLVCLAQFGFLAGLGFAFFHTIGSIAGTLRQMRGMTAGKVPNPWPWRFGNWLVSFLVTAWLAGGFI